MSYDVMMDHKKQCKECMKHEWSNKDNPKDESSETITKEQLEELEYELADMPKSKFLMIISHVRAIKNDWNEGIE